MRIDLNGRIRCFTSYTVSLKHVHNIYAWRSKPIASLLDCYGYLKAWQAR